MMQSSSKGYGAVSGPGGKKKKRVAVISASAVILVAMVVAVVVIAVNYKVNTPPQEASTTIKAIESLCEPTDYKETCKKSLREAAGSNVTDSKQLLGLAFKVAIDNVHKVFNHSKTFQEARRDPRTAHALDNCQELLDYAVDDLQHSYDQIGAFDVTKIGKIIDNTKIWLSGAITYQETCLDGFENATGSVAESMRKAMNSSAEMTSNALAMVSALSNLISDMDLPTTTGNSKRKLLSDDGSPEWLSKRKRRLLAATTVAAMKPNVVVAKDGSGDYRTINDAILAIPKKSKTPFVMYIKAGVYKEYVQINKSMANVVMVGDGPTKTIITGSKNYIDGTPTFKTASAAIIGPGFVGKNLGFENTAGPEKHQAVALRVQSDMSVFYNCRMDGYQDTLYVHAHRQFYRECTITGTIDFIFGNSATVFQNCLMLVRRPMANQQTIVTAQGRKERREPTALVLHNCTIRPDASFLPLKTKTGAYLGRPWKEYSRTLILQSQIDDLISPQGWLPWTGNFGLNTCFYAEFDNRGPGAGTSQRVTWRGIKKLNYEHAQIFSVENFIDQEGWVRKSGVTYVPGLLPVGSTMRDPSGPIKGVIGPPRS